MVDTDLVLIHGFWSSPTTWDRLTTRMLDDQDLRVLHIHAFMYESPKLRCPGSPARIPDYNDIAQSLPAYLDNHTLNTTPVAIVTHSQGGLILQRYLAWMLGECRGRELARIRLIVMLSCPNEGSEYLRSIRAVIGLRRHPQAGELKVLDREVGEARRIVLRQIVNATTLDDQHCPIPVYVYSGRTDNVVRRKSAQGDFPNAAVLPGDHFTILDPDAPGNLTLPTLKRHLLNITALPIEPLPVTANQSLGSASQSSAWQAELIRRSRHEATFRLYSKSAEHSIRFKKGWWLNCTIYIDGKLVSQKHGELEEPILIDDGDKQIRVNIKEYSTFYDDSIARVTLQGARRIGRIRITVDNVDVYED